MSLSVEILALSWRGEENLLASALVKVGAAFTGTFCVYRLPDGGNVVQPTLEYRAPYGVPKCGGPAFSLPSPYRAAVERVVLAAFAHEFPLKGAAAPPSPKNGGSV